MQLRILLKMGLFILLVFFVLSANAQNKTITGKIVDSQNNSPLAGVSVSVKGTTIGTMTSAEGTFRLSVPASATTLSVRYIGYTSKDVPITGNTITVALEPTATALNEVQIVSVGYGSQRKKDVTGAVANLSTKNFNQGAIINPLDQVAGKVSGLQVTQPGGDPNQNASIRLRGQSSISAGLDPLFVVDGVILDDPAQFQNIPPGDIASYDVLKDASAAAIYGSRGANGVIIVTTKRGSAGKTTVDYNGYVSTSHQSKYYDLLTGGEMRAAVPNLGSIDKGANTDWQRAITRTAFTQSHNVSISGGSQTFNYTASVNYNDQQGIVINSDKQQLGLRFTAEQKALDNKLDIQVGLSNVNTNRKLFDYSTFSYMYNSPPTYPVYNSDGSYFLFSDFNLANPVEHLRESYYRTNEYLTLLHGSIAYNITPDLRISAAGSTNRNNVQTHVFIPSFPLEGNLNFAGQGNENTNSYKGNLQINYDKTFGKHKLSLLGGYEYNDYLYSYFAANGQQYIIPQQLDNNLGAGNGLLNKIRSYKEEYNIVSFFARAAYNFNDRFYATATIRQDGSSKFGSQYQHGWFPSFDLAYRFKNDFFSNVDWINDLKLRAGYGVTGNTDRIGPYSSIGIVNSVGYYYDRANNYYPAAFSTTQNENTQLRWEERRGKNIGLDFELLGGRLSGDINYYNDKTVHLLYPYAVPTPPFVYPTILANVGSLSNKGLEIALNGQIVKGDKFNWNANGQITFSKTTIDNLSGQYQTSTGQVYQLTVNQIPITAAVGRGLSATYIDYMKTGYGPNVFYLPHYTGTDANGNQTFDGQTIAQNATPKSYFIDPNPKFFYGLTNNFSYGDFTFNFALRGVYGQKVFNNTLLDIETITRLPGNNITKEALTNGIKDAPVASDKWLENASFLRLDNATLSYTFRHIKFTNSFRVFVSSNNLFIITKYRGQDPEIKTVNSFPSIAGFTGNIVNNTNITGSQNQAYIDANYGGQAYYPRTRTFTLGVNVSLK